MRRLLLGWILLAASAGAAGCVTVTEAPDPFYPMEYTHPEEPRKYEVTALDALDVVARGLANSGP